MAVLTVAEPLADSIALGTVAEFAALQPGKSLTLLGSENSVEAVDRFQDLTIQAHPAKVLEVFNVEKTPGAPRVLKVTGSFPEQAGGDPLIGAKGNLLGVYSEPERPDKDGSSAHYIKVIDAQIVQAALEGNFDKFWSRVEDRPAKSK